MKKVLMIFAAILIAIITLNAQDEKPTKGKIKIMLIGFEKNEGKAMIALSNSKEDYEYQKETFKRAMSEIVDNHAVLDIDSLEYGTYAVKVFHDANSNGYLDKNFLGIPTEEYGFSNNARGTFGPASWGDANFVLNKDSLFIEIEVD